MLQFPSNDDYCRDYEINLKIKLESDYFLNPNDAIILIVLSRSCDNFKAVCNHLKNNPRKTSILKLLFQ